MSKVTQLVGNSARTLIQAIWLLILHANYSKAACASGSGIINSSMPPNKTWRGRRDRSGETRESEESNFHLPRVKCFLTSNSDSLTVRRLSFPCNPLSNLPPPSQKMCSDIREESKCPYLHLVLGCIFTQPQR